jgi:hypothetical protein
MAIFDSGLSNISILIDVPFPSNVVSGPGVLVNKTNSVWSVQLDIPDLTENTSISTPSGYYTVVWDQALTRYEKVRLDNLNLPTLVDFRSPIGDANYAVSVNDRYIGLTATLTAIRTIILPAASSVPAGRQVVLQDEVGGVSDAFYHSIVPTGADTINGGASWIQKASRGGVILRSNGANAWNVLVMLGRSPVADANYTATFGGIMIAYTSITAARIVTLPAASAFQAGQRLTIIDESGSCSAANTIGVSRAGTDTINGATSQTISQAYGYLALESNGAGKWTIVDSSALASTQISDSSAAGRAMLTAASVAAQRSLLDQRTGVGDAIYTILNTDRYVATTAAFTAARIWTLPAANTMAAGQEVVIYDEAGGVTSTNTLTITRAGSDTVNGGTTFVLDRAYQGISLRTDGVSKWALEDPAGPIDGTVIGAVTPAAGSFTTLSSSGPATLNSASVTTTLGVTGASALAGAVTFNTAPASFLNQGRLTFVSTTSLAFKPYNGSMIKINGNQYLIPSAGIAGLGNPSSVFKEGVATQSLTAGAVYYVYAFLNSGTVTADFSTTGHATSATAGNVGTEIKSGDDTRSLIGMVAINAGPTYIDSDSARYVISWFNRQPKRLRNSYTAARTVATTAFSEPSSEIRCNFIIWSDDILRASVSGYMDNNTIGTAITASLGIDGITPGATIGQIIVNANDGFSIGLSDVMSGISEGSAHFMTLLGAVSSGTVRFTKSGGASNESFPTISGFING